jgi:hypothetical protein
VGGFHETIIEPMVKVIPEIGPGIAGVKGSVFKEALSSGQGQPGLIPIHVG